MGAKEERRRRLSADDMQDRVESNSSLTWTPTEIINKLISLSS